MVDGTLVLFGTVVFGVLCENFLGVGALGCFYIQASVMLLL
jgi:hypothetical protein